MSLGYVGKEELNKKHAEEAASTGTAINGKQTDLTKATGYDATKTQVLKNVEGTLTWVTEEAPAGED